MCCAAIAEGKAGYAKLSRGEFAKADNIDHIINGTEVTCLQDSLIVAARYAGARVRQAEVYTDLVLPLDGEELDLPTFVCYAREKVCM